MDQKAHLAAVLLSPYPMRGDEGFFPARKANSRYSFPSQDFPLSSSFFDLTWMPGRQAQGRRQVVRLEFMPLFFRLPPPPPPPPLSHAAPKGKREGRGRRLLRRSDEEGRKFSLVPLFSLRCASVSHRQMEGNVLPCSNKLHLSEINQSLGLWFHCSSFVVTRFLFRSFGSPAERWMRLNLERGGRGEKKDRSGWGHGWMVKENFKTI